MARLLRRVDGYRGLALDHWEFVGNVVETQLIRPALAEMDIQCELTDDSMLGPIDFIVKAETGRVPHDLFVINSPPRFYRMVGQQEVVEFTGEVVGWNFHIQNGNGRVTVRRMNL